MKASSLLCAAGGSAAALLVPHASADEQERLRTGDTENDGGRSKARDPFTDEFQDLTKDIMEQWKVPGMSIAVIDGDDVFAKGFGFATLPDTPATPETLYYAGSTTKAQTAATLAHIIDSKNHSALSHGWSTPIASIIRDDFVLQDEWATNHITLDDAVSHRTGMPGHDDAWHRERNGKELSAGDVVRNLRNLPLGAEARVNWHYCNMMYTTLSHVIETVTGKWLGDVMDEVIWKPLGMKTTYLSLRQAQDGPAHLASSYMWRDGQGKYEELPFISAKAFGGAGGVISSVLDYAKWIQCLIRESAPFSKAVHDDIRTPRMLEPQAGLTSDIGLYGLGWTRTTIHGEVVYWHDGSTISYGAEVYWLPNINYGVVAFANGAVTSNDAEKVLVRRLIEQRLEVPAEKRVDLNKRSKERSAQHQRDIENADEILFPNRPKQPLPPALEVSELAGKYQHPGYGSFTLFQEPHPDNSKLNESILVANRTELVFAQQWRLHHVSGDFWALKNKVVLANINVVWEFHAAEFKIGADGKVAGLEVAIRGRGGPVKEGSILFEKIE